MAFRIKSAAVWVLAAVLLCLCLIRPAYAADSPAASGEEALAVAVDITCRSASYHTITVTPEDAPEPSQRKLRLKNETGQFAVSLYEPGDYRYLISDDDRTAEYRITLHVTADEDGTLSETTVAETAEGKKSGIVFSYGKTGGSSSPSDAVRKITDQVKTGDEAKLAVYMAVFVFAMAVLLLVSARRKEKDEKLMAENGMTLPSGALTAGNRKKTERGGNKG